ncbi:hypothetical protein C0J52_13356 [Blattella germanica]|nr:hypothetical protein C0J52_13356 [Blattella germanica]
MLSPESEHTHTHKGAAQRSNITFLSMAGNGMLFILRRANHIRLYTTSIRYSDIKKKTVTGVSYYR